MKIGILGGSGLYEMDTLAEIEEISLETPFGAPSDPYIRGILNGVEVFFLPRHGKGHRLLPSEINYRANIFGFKMLGVDRVISVSAVGSLKAELRPRDIVLPDQYYDRTKGSSRHTFFGNGLVAHVSFGDPACADLRSRANDSALKVISEAGSQVRVNNGGTYVNMEGPAFSTKAESNVHRHLGFDIVGMTGMAEARLCREAELCYQAISMVTDYDCWHEEEEPVTVEMVIGHLMANAELAKNILKDLIPAAAASRTCSCHQSLKDALITRPDAVPESLKEKMQPIIGKYLPA
jgi:5'-methylthioadenosine phosphorylase